MILAKLKLGAKQFLIRSTKDNVFLKAHGDWMGCPVIKKGPLGTWVISWEGWEMEWSLTRWS